MDEDIGETVAPPKSTFERLVTNEAGLFVYRIVTSGAAILLLFWMHNLLAQNDDVRVQLSTLNFTVSNQITALTGKVQALDDRVSAQSRRMDGFQTDLRDTNNRITDYLMKYPYGGNYGTPR